MKKNSFLIVALLFACALLSGTGAAHAQWKWGYVQTPAISGTDGTQVAQFPGAGIGNVIGLIRPLDGGGILANNLGPGSSGTAPGASFPILSGTLAPPNLPAAAPITFYFAVTSPTSSALYVKTTGTGSAGWWPMTSGTAAIQ